MKLIDNVNTRLGDDLKETIRKDSKLSIAASTFSIYAFEALKKELSIRIFGVDTPEKGHRAGCPAEAQRGEMASAYTKQLVAAAKTRQIALMGWDKYGGRVLGDVILNGVSLRQSLIQNGFAREYYGEAKHSWC